MHYALTLFSLFFVLPSCQKDDRIVTPVDKEPIPEKGIPIYVPAGRWSWYYAYGTGSGYKNGNKFAFTPSTWELPEKEDVYSLLINTFSSPDSIYLREVISILLPEKPGLYTADRDPGYIGLIDGGDITNFDRYKLDRSKPYWIDVEIADKEKNMIKGTMEAHFYLIDTVNKYYADTPNHLHFTNLKFETKYKM